MTTRLIMVPGMGADGRLFAPQTAAGFKLEVAPFPTPGRHDDLPTYAARVADQLDLDSSCVIGGVSFGGMVACELARICNPRAVLLIASCRSRDVLPSYYSAVEWFSRLIPDILVKRRAEASSRMLAKLESLTPEQAQLIRDMSLDVPIPFLRRVGRMIVSWRGVPHLPCPVRHIHGAKDHIIPLGKVRPDEIVSDGGHLINLTHSGSVNDFILRHLDSRSSEVA